MTTKTIDKPWGREILWANTDHYAGKIVEINPLKKLDLQSHLSTIKSIYVLAGELRLGRPTGTRIFFPGQSVDIPAGENHYFESGPNGVTLIEVSANSDG